MLVIGLSFTQTITGPSTSPSSRRERRCDVRTGKMLPNQTIVVENGKIVSIGDSGADTSATVIDLSSKTILPGLIDAHTHLTMNPSFGYEALAISCRARR